MMAIGPGLRIAVLVAALALSGEPHVPDWLLTGTISEPTCTCSPYDLPCPCGTPLPPRHDIPVGTRVSFRCWISDTEQSMDYTTMLMTCEVIEP